MIKTTGIFVFRNIPIYLFDKYLYNYIFVAEQRPLIMKCFLIVDGLFSIVYKLTKLGNSLMIILTIRSIE